MAPNLLVVSPAAPQHALPAVQEHISTTLYVQPATQNTQIVLFVTQQSAPNARTVTFWKTTSATIAPLASLAVFFAIHQCAHHARQVTF